LDSFKVWDVLTKNLKTKLIANVAMEFNYFDYIVLPFLIFFARILDVSIGTIRMIFVSKGLKKVAPVLGFFEVFIWIVAIGEIMNGVNHWFYYIFYAGGFAAGTYVGIVLEEKLSVGKTLVRIITQKESDKLIKKIKEEGYKITFVNAQGKHGEVKIIFTIINKKKLKKVINLIKEFNPKAFYTIEDVRYVNEPFEIKQKKLFGFYRKGK
jgi:uncharacterized protein YebE (UPF0316 family)